MTVEQWELVLSPAAKRTVQQLPEKIATAVAEFMTSTLRHSPQRVGKPLNHALGGSMVARRGVYRIVYDLNTRTHTIEVLRIDHRSDIYRRF